MKPHISHVSSASTAVRWFGHSCRQLAFGAALLGAMSCAEHGTEPGPGAAATVTKHAGDDQQAPVGTLVGIPPAVRVTDVAGNPVSGISVTFAVTSGGGVAYDADATTDSDGIATIGGWNLGASLGPQALTATVAGSAANSATFTATAVGSAIAVILDSLRTAWDLPSLAAAVVTRQGTIAVGVAGVRRSGTTAVATLTDKFHIGSNLKAITAGLLGLLVDDGKLQWTTTLPQALPTLSATMRSEYHSVTIADLLSHQSGFLRDPTITFSDPTPRQQRDSLARWAVRQAPATARGTFRYSNVNYMIAGSIAERISNLAYEQLLSDQLLAPIGVTSLGFGAAGTPNTEDQPWGHYINSSGARVAVSPGSGADNPPVYGPAGRGHLSIVDWATWIRAVLRAEGGLSSPWKPATASTLTRGAVSVGSGDSYAMGWLVTRRGWAGPTQRVLTHDGTNLLNYSVAWLAPDAGWGVIAVSNQGGERAAQALDATAGRMISYYFDRR